MTAIAPPHGPTAGGGSLIGAGGGQARRAYQLQVMVNLVLIAGQQLDDGRRLRNAGQQPVVCLRLARAAARRAARATCR